MKGINFIVIFSVMLCSSILDVEAKIKVFNPFQDQDIRDLTFDVTSPSIDKLLQTKLMLPQMKSLRMKVFWSKGKEVQTELIIELSRTEVDPEILKKIKEELSLKVVALIKSNLYSNLADYKKTKLKDGSFRYQDDSGLKELEQFTIKESSKEILVVAKNANGDEITNYQIKKFPWSRKLPVVFQVKREQSNKLQETKVETKVSFGRFGKYWLPKKLQSNIHQILRVSPIDKYKSERRIEEQILFENYSINKDMASKWMSKQKSK